MWERDGLGSWTLDDRGRDDYTYTCNLYRWYRRTKLSRRFFPLLFPVLLPFSSKELSVPFETVFLADEQNRFGWKRVFSTSIITRRKTGRKIIIWNCGTSGIAELGPYPATWPK